MILSLFLYFDLINVFKTGITPFFYFKNEKSYPRLLNRAASPSEWWTPVLDDYKKGIYCVPH
jgi:hypothetical protein